MRCGSTQSLNLASKFFNNLGETIQVETPAGIEFQYEMEVLPPEAADSIGRYRWGHN